MFYCWRNFDFFWFFHIENVLNVFFVFVCFCVALFCNMWILCLRRLTMYKFVCLYVESTYSTRDIYFIITNNLRIYFCFLNRSRFFNFKNCRVCFFVEIFLFDFVLNLFVFRRFVIRSNLRFSRSFFRIQQLRFSHFRNDSLIFTNFCTTMNLFTKWDIEIDFFNTFV